MLVVAGYLGFSYYKPKASNSSEDKNSPVVTQPTTTDSSTPNTSQTEKGVTGSVDASKTTADVPVSKEVTVRIDQLSRVGNDIVYQATVTNPGNIGTCSAVFTKDGAKPVTQDNNTTSGSCGPFKISNYKFDMLGSWLLTLRYYTDSSQAVATKTIEIR